MRSTLKGLKAEAQERAERDLRAILHTLPRPEITYVLRIFAPSPIFNIGEMA